MGKGLVAGDVEGSRSQINHLPDDILLLIFDRILDANSICRISVVSKRFSSIVTKIHAIYLKIPPPPPSEASNFLNKSVLSRAFRVFGGTTGHPPASAPPTLPFDGKLLMSAAKFLKKFSSMRELTIEFPPLLSVKSVVKWNAEFGRDMSLCVILFATSFCAGEEVGGSENEPEIAADPNLLRQRIESTKEIFSHAAWKQHTLGHFAKDHGMLEVAAIVDSKRLGRLRLNGEQLVDLSKSVKLPVSGYVNVWHVPVLHLPLSGQVMKGVTLFAIRPTDVPKGDDDRLPSLVDRAFVGEEDVFKEAVTLIIDHNVSLYTFGNKHVFDCL